MKAVAHPGTVHGAEFVAFDTQGAVLGGDVLSLATARPLFISEFPWRRTSRNIAELAPVCRRVGATVRSLTDAGAPPGKRSTRSLRALPPPAPVTTMTRSALRASGSFSNTIKL